jgi:nitric oxide reductase activation protein
MVKSWSNHGPIMAPSWDNHKTSWPKHCHIMAEQTTTTNKTTKQTQKTQKLKNNHNRQKQKHKKTSKQQTT